MTSFHYLKQPAHSRLSRLFLTGSEEDHLNCHMVQIDPPTPQKIKIDPSDTLFF